jgi:hypothetical protein
VTDFDQQPPPVSETDLETGIFNLVVTLTRMYTASMPAELAKEKTALYLERLASGLRATPEEPLPHERNDRWTPET